MNSAAYEIFVLASLSSETVSFLISLLYCYRSFNPKYMRIFPIFCFLELAADIITSYSKQHSLIKLEIITSNLLTVFEVMCLCYFFSNIMHSSYLKRIVWILSISFFILVIAQTSKDGIGKTQAANIIIESVMLIVFCMLFFKQILSRYVIDDLSHYPAFWIVTGILFYSAITIPLLMCKGYFVEKGMRQFVEGLIMIHAFFIVVTNVLFIKGCTCRINRL
jgi:hypothetical protein